MAQIRKHRWILGQDSVKPEKEIVLTVPAIEVVNEKDDTEGDDSKKDVLPCSVQSLPPPAVPGHQYDQRVLTAMQNAGINTESVIQVRKQSLLYHL